MISFFRRLFSDNSVADVGVGQHQFPGHITTPAPQPIQGPVFSSAEENRLHEIQIEWAKQIKEHKIQSFKALNQNVRQHIIDSVQFYAAISELNSQHNMPQMPIEMQILLEKKEICYMHNGRGWGRPLNFRHDFMQHAYMPQFKIHASQYSFIDMENHFCGLTLGDLVKAHTDVTVDEEVLGDKP